MLGVPGVLLASLVFAGCDFTIKTRPNGAANAIERHMDYYSKRLHIGMPRYGVLALLPKPQNINTQNVCVWVLESTETIKAQDRYDWQWLQKTRGGYFVVFVDDKLATPLCANAAFDPWQALEHYAKMTNDQAKRILGPKP